MIIQFMSNPENVFSETAKLTAGNATDLLRKAGFTIKTGGLVREPEGDVIVIDMKLADGENAIKFREYSELWSAAGKKIIVGMAEFPNQLSNEILAAAETFENAKKIQAAAINGYEEQQRRKKELTNEETPEKSVSKSASPEGQLIQKSPDDVTEMVESKEYDGPDLGGPEKEYDGPDLGGPGKEYDGPDLGGPEKVTSKESDNLAELLEGFSVLEKQAEEQEQAPLTEKIHGQGILGNKSEIPKDKQAANTESADKDEKRANNERIEKSEKKVSIEKTTTADRTEKIEDDEKPGNKKSPYPGVSPLLQNTGTVRIGVLGVGKCAGASFISMAIASQISMMGKKKRHPVTLISVGDSEVFEICGMEKKFSNKPFFKFAEAVHAGASVKGECNLSGGVNWVVITPEDANLKLTTDEKRKLLYRAGGNVIVYDFSAEDSLEEIIELSGDLDVLICIIDPLPSKIMVNYDRLEAVKELKIPVLYVLNKYNTGVKKGQITSFLDIKQVSTVPMVDCSSIYKSEYRSECPWENKDVRKTAGDSITGIIRDMNLLPMLWQR